MTLRIYVWIRITVKPAHLREPHKVLISIVRSLSTGNREWTEYIILSFKNNHIEQKTCKIHVKLLIQILVLNQHGV